MVAWRRSLLKLAIAGACVGALVSACSETLPLANLPDIAKLPEKVMSKDEQQKTMNQMIEKGQTAQADALKAVVGADGEDPEPGPVGDERGHPSSSQSGSQRLLRADFRTDRGDELWGGRRPVRYDSPNPRSSQLGPNQTGCSSMFSRSRQRLASAESQA